jgi:hypothetical protein
LTGTNLENFVVEDCIFKQCSSSKGGGVYMFRGNENVLMKKLTVLNCTSTDGAGIFVNGEDNANAHIQIVESVFQGNKASSFGGAIAADNSNKHVIIVGCKFLNNFAAINGKVTCVM